MEVDAAVTLGIRVLMLSMLICAPILAAALVVGVLVSILQAVTQIQEMTLTFVGSSLDQGHLEDFISRIQNSVFISFNLRVAGYWKL